LHDASFTSIISRQYQWVVVVKQFCKVAQILDTTLDVFSRLEDLVHPHALGCFWHQLHQATRSCGTHSVGIEIRFDFTVTTISC
jgi:hypothetical protein